MLNDQPSKTDPLGRRPFANSVARIIATQHDEAPLVIAIDGVWGSGKTTVFGFIEEALDKQHGLKALEFNPWHHENGEEMTRAFALSLAKKLDVRIQNNVQNWLDPKHAHFDLFNKLASMVGYEKTADLINYGVNKFRAPVSKLLLKVRAELSQYARRVTILVDDPDRLDADQLLSLFRLIKLTADLPWVTFVLAMDCEAITRTIAKRFGDDDEGKRFIEKIIQVPIRLPTIPKFQLKDFAMNLINEVLADLSIKIEGAEINRFVAGFDEAIMPMIRNPRQAKQFANVTRFSLGLLLNEINPVDVMLLEGIRLFHRKVFDLLPECILPKSGSYLSELLDADDVGKGSSTALDKLGANSVDESRESLKLVLALIFPSKFSSIVQDETALNEWANARRVACDEYFIRYLAAAVPENDVSDSDVNRWLQEAASGDVNALAASLASSLNPKTETIWASKLRRIQKSLTEDQRTTFVSAIAGISDKLTWSGLPKQSEIAFEQSAIFVADCITAFPGTVQRESLSGDVIKSAMFGVWACIVFKWIRYTPKSEGHVPGEDDQRHFLSSESTAKVGMVLAERLICDLESEEKLPSVEELRMIFRVCVSYGKDQRLKRWLRSAFVKNIHFVYVFASIIMDWDTGSERRYLNWPGDQKILERCREYIDPNWLAQSVTVPLPQMNGSEFNISEQEAAYRMIESLRKDTSLQEKCG